jgi:hypothetical protein
MRAAICRRCCIVIGFSITGMFVSRRKAPYSGESIVRPSSPWLGRFSPLASFQLSLQLLLELVGRIANINALAVPPSAAPVPATLPPGLGRRPPQEPTAQRFMEHHGELAPRH